MEKREVRGLQEVEKRHRGEAGQVGGAEEEIQKHGIWLFESYEERVLSSASVYTETQSV